ncbi:MAG: divergent polysaccharide deacetylase family protein [Spirochaetaceae bacterium]|nr:divergent polysaccharide deacetylase family protein [Spirochaetaceae bacterium]
MSTQRRAQQVPQARLVVALVTMIVVLTGVLVGLVLRPPAYDNSGPGAEPARPLPNLIERLKIPATGLEPPPYLGTIPDHETSGAESYGADHPPDGAQAPDPEPAPAAQPPRTPGAEVKLAIVIDDAGNNLQELKPYLEFPGPLTFAVLPQLHHSARAAELARAHGHEVILHLPMAAISGKNPGPGTISEELSEVEIRLLLELNFASISGAVGTNNHMGSAGTADARIMDAVMAYLADTGRFFVDSRTTASSVAAVYASKHGVPFMARDVFLDHDRDPAAIRSALRQGLAVARRQGHAVLIGHSSVREVAMALLEVYPHLQEQGFVVVPLSELVPIDGGAVTISHLPATSEGGSTGLAAP